MEARKRLIEQGLQKLEEFRRNKNKYVTPVKKRDRKQRTPASSSIRKVKEEKEKERVHVSSSSSSSSASSSLLSSVNGTSFQSPSVKSDRRHRRISNTDSTHESSTSAATTASAALSPADLDAAVFPSSASSSVISPVKLSVSTCLDEDADPTNHTTSSTMDSSDGKTINNNDDGSGTHTRYASSVSSPDDATAHGSKSARLNVDVDASSRHMDVFGKGNGILSAPSVDRVFSFSSSAVGASVQQQQNSGNIYTMGNQGNSDGRSDTSTSTNTNTNTNSNDNDHHDITLLPETPTTPSLSASTPLSSTSSTTTASTASSASAIPSGMKLVDAQYLVDMKEYISSQAREIERLNSVDREVSTYKLEIQELTLNNTGLVDEKATLLGDIEVLTVRCQALTAEKEELGQMTATIGRLAKESDELRSERDRLNKVSQSLQDALRSQGDRVTELLEDNCRLAEEMEVMENENNQLREKLKQASSSSAIAIVTNSIATSILNASFTAEDTDSDSDHVYDTDGTGAGAGAGAGDEAETGVGGAGKVTMPTDADVSSTRTTTADVVAEVVSGISSGSGGGDGAVEKDEADSEEREREKQLLDSLQLNSERFFNISTKLDYDNENAADLTPLSERGYANVNDYSTAPGRNTGNAIDSNVGICAASASNPASPDSVHITSSSSPATSVNYANGNVEDSDDTETLESHDNPPLLHQNGVSSDMQLSLPPASPQTLHNIETQCRRLEKLVVQLQELEEDTNSIMSRYLKECNSNMHLMQHMRTQKGAYADADSHDGAIDGSDGSNDSGDGGDAADVDETQHTGAVPNAGTSHDTVGNSTSDEREKAKTRSDNSATGETATIGDECFFRFQSQVQTATHQRGVLIAKLVDQLDELREQVDPASILMLASSQSPASFAPLPLSATSSMHSVNGSAPHATSPHHPFITLSPSKNNYNIGSAPPQVHGTHGTHDTHAHAHAHAHVHAHAEAMHNPFINKDIYKENQQQRAAKEKALQAKREAEKQTEAALIKLEDIKRENERLLREQKALSHTVSDHQERAGSLQQDKALLARRIQESDEEKTTLIQTLRSSMDEFGKEYDRLSKEYSAFQDRHTVLEQKHSACGVRFSAVEASMHAQQNELIKAGTIQRELIGEIKRVYQLYMQCLSHARAHTSPSHTQELEPLDMTMNGADDRLEDSVGGSGMTGTNGSDDGGEHKDESEAAGDEKSEGGDDDNVNNISMDIYGVAKMITDGNADSADSADIAADISVDGSDVDTEITGTDGDDASVLPSSLISPLDIRPITNEETIAIEKKLEYLHRHLVPIERLLHDKFRSHITPAPFYVSPQASPSRSARTQSSSSSSSTSSSTSFSAPSSTRHASEANVGVEVDGNANAADGDEINEGKDAVSGYSDAGDDNAVEDDAKAFGELSTPSPTRKHQTRSGADPSSFAQALSSSPITPINLSPYLVGLSGDDAVKDGPHPSLSAGTSPPPSPKHRVEQKKAMKLRRERMAKQSTPTARLFDQLLYVLSLGFIDDETYDGMDDDELELYLQQSDDDYSQDAIDVDVDVEDVSSASGSSNAVGSTHHADSAEVKATPEQSDVDGSSSSGGGDSNRISYGERVNLSQHIEGKRKKFVFTPPLVI